MPTIADYRSRFPSLAGLSDRDLIGRVAEVQGVEPQAVEAHMGYKPPTMAQQAGAGFKRAFEEVPGLVAGVGAFAADVVGADGARDSMLAYAKRKQDEVGAAHVNDAQSITDAWDGKVGWLDFLANSSGYVAGQALQSLATGGLGAVGAKMLAVPGIKAFAETAAAKALAEATAAKAIATGATEEVAQAAAATAVADGFKAYGNKIATRGAVLGAGAQNFNMELGSIYPDAVDEAKAKDHTLDAGDKFRVFAAASLAAGVDTAGEAIMATRLFKGSKVGMGAEKPPTVFGSEFAGRAVREVPAGMAREAGTEALQTGIEHYGAGTPIADDKGLRDIIDSAGVGAVGGMLGGLGAATRRRKAAAPQADPADVLDHTKTLDQSIDTAMLAIAAPVAKADWQTVDEQGNLITAGLPALPGPAAAPPTGGMLRLLPGPDGAPVYMADERGNVTIQPAEHRTEAQNAAFAAQQAADAAEVERTSLGEQRARGAEPQRPDLAAGEAPGMAPRRNTAAVPLDLTGRLAVHAYISRLAEENTPAARAYVQDYRAGRVTPDDVLGRMNPQRPTEASPDERIARAAAQAPKADLEAGDLVKDDGAPYIHERSAKVRAYQSGGSVIEVPGGFAVRPKDGANDNKPDVPGTAGQPAANGAGRPFDDLGSSVAAGRVAADATGSQPGAAAAVAQSGIVAAPAGLGDASNQALTPGQRVTLDGKDWTVLTATPNMVTMDNGAGMKKAVRAGSPNWNKITTNAPTATPAPSPEAAAPEGGAGTAPASAPVAGPGRAAGVEADGVDANPDVNAAPLVQQEANASATIRQAAENRRKDGELNKFYESLIGRSSTVHLAESGGRTLHKVQITPSMRNKHRAADGRYPETEGFQLKLAEDVTGNPYDKGYILIDRRVQASERKGAAADANTPAAPIQPQAQDGVSTEGAGESRPTLAAPDSVLRKPLGEMLKETGTQGVWLGRLNQPDGPSVEVKVIKWPNRNMGEFGFQWFHEGKPEKGIPFPGISQSTTAQELSDTLTSYLNADDRSGATPTFSMDQIGDKHGAIIGRQQAVARRKEDAVMQAARKWRGDDQVRPWDATDADLKQKHDAIAEKRFKTANDEKMLALLKRRAEARPDKWASGDGIGHRVTSDQINRGFRIVSVDAKNKTANIRQVADTGLTSTGGNSDRIGNQTVNIGDLVRDRKYDAPKTGDQAQADAAFDAADVLGLKGEQRRESAAESLAANWGMTQDEVREADEFKASAKKPPRKAPQTKANERAVEAVVRQAQATPQPSEPSTAAPVAESASPRDRDSGDGGVAPTTAGSAPNLEPEPAGLADAWGDMNADARTSSLQAADMGMNTPTGRASVETKRIAALPWKKLPQALRDKLRPQVALHMPRATAPAPSPAAAPDSRPTAAAEPSSGPKRLDVLNMAEPDIVALAGKTVTIEAMVSDTGKTAQIKMDAAEAVRDIQQRVAAASKLKGCLK